MNTHRNALVGFFLALILLSISCIRQRELVTKPVQDSIVDIDATTAILMYEDPSDMPLHDDPAEIINIELQGDSLMLVTESGGGCEVHDYMLFGCHCFMESFPVQTNVFLSHDDHDDPCDAIVIDTLRFDLTPLKEAFLSYYPSDETLILRIFEPGAGQPVDTTLVYGM